VTAVTATPGRRPVPWPRLAWVACRQHRAALAGTAVVLGGLSVYMLVMGLRIRGVYASVAACHPARSAACLLLASQLDSYHGWAAILTGVLQVVPVLIGVFTGGPLLARELESGTFRFAWTQGCGRRAGQSPSWRSSRRR
jgi:hypothetical protein